jgi:hypothetical protein
MYYVQSNDGVTTAFTEQMTTYIPYIADACHMATQSANPLPVLDVNNQSLKHIKKYLDIIITHNIKVIPEASTCVLLKKTLIAPIVNYASPKFDLAYPAPLTSFLSSLSSDELWNVFHAACFMNMTVSALPIAATVLWRLWHNDALLRARLEVYGDYYERVLSYVFERTSGANAHP